ncbi:hypothetical protein [Micromonospora avicenniae]|uniref:hypothetical protein n=1 Tax=Micromonospora avicenniae TaxID=1198245 RepID=UPI001FE9DAD8|nr:hypothetical protein [Micromonospora avicenniae]
MAPILPATARAGNVLPQPVVLTADRLRLVAGSGEARRDDVGRLLLVGGERVAAGAGGRSGVLLTVSVR